MRHLPRERARHHCAALQAHVHVLRLLAGAAPRLLYMFALALPCAGIERSLCHAAHTACRMLMCKEIRC